MTDSRWTGPRDKATGDAISFVLTLGLTALVQAGKDWWARRQAAKDAASRSPSAPPQEPAPQQFPPGQ